MPISEAKKPLYVRRREVGHCVQCGADAGGKSKCVACMSKDRECRKRRIEQRKQTGLCQSCGEKTKDGTTMCQPCIDKASEGSLRRYYKNKADGVCRYCGAETGGKARCPSCQGKNSSYQKARYQECRKDAVCYCCGATTEGTAYCSDCREIKSEKSRDYYRRLRASIIEAYGAECVRCGYDDPAALQLDHIEGGGTRHFKTDGPVNVYRQVRDEGFPPTYQLLCANCNAKKGAVPQSAFTAS